jgi:hypothetical protein
MRTILYTLCIIFLTYVAYRPSAAVANGGTMEVLGKVVSDDHKIVIIDNVRRNEYILRVRIVQRADDLEPGSVLTLVSQPRENSSLDNSIFDILDTTRYGRFSIYRQGRRWMISDAQVINVRIQSENISPIELTNGFLVNIESDSFSKLESKEITKRSTLSGNSGISIGK